MKTAKQPIQVFSKQLQFLSSNKKEVMYAGGLGGGKSRALAIALFKNAQVIGAKCLLIRKTSLSLKKPGNVLDVLMGTKNPVLLPNSYFHHKQDCVIKLNGGGEIYYCGMNNATRILSTEFSFIAIDEARELSEEEYLTLFYRLRSDIGSLQLVCATNPATPSHFLYKRYFLDKSLNREVITAKTYDNPFLPKDYIDSFADLSPSQKEKLVEGKWISVENAIYSEFSRDKHVRHLKEDTYDDYYLGLDFGFTDPTCLIAVGRKGDRLFVLEELYKRKMLLDQIKGYVIEFSNKYNNPTLIVDPSAALLIAEFQNIGINAIKANNDISVGIARVRSRLMVRNDSPDIIINDTCVNGIAEMENYCYEDETEKPRPGNDHFCDPLRYVVNYLDDKKCTYQIPIVYTGEDIGEYILEDNNNFI